VLLAIVAARSRYQQLYPDVPTEKLVVYVTTQTHSLGLKAGLILGLPVFTIPVRAEDNYSLRGQDLREVIERDKAKGKHPILLSETDSLTHARQGLNFYSSWYCRNYLEWRD
jgi:aromatic-L-amino-acid decarboxylase